MKNGDRYEVIFPWKDSAYEGLEGKHLTARVPTVKMKQRNVIGRSSLDFQWLEIALREVGAVVILSTDKPSPIPPARCLVGHQVTVLAELATTEVGTGLQSTHAETVCKLSHRQRLVKCFWNRWKKKYLLQLRSAHQSLKGAA